MSLAANLSARKLQAVQAEHAKELVELARENSSGESDSELDRDTAEHARDELQAMLATCKEQLHAAESAHAKVLAERAGELRAVRSEVAAMQASASGQSVAQLHGQAELERRQELQVEQSEQFRQQQSESAQALAAQEQQLGALAAKLAAGASDIAALRAQAVAREGEVAWLEEELRSASADRDAACEAQERSEVTASAELQVSARCR
jgi:hypothetical protein